MVFTSSKNKKIFFGIILLLVFLAVFLAGIFVGYGKAIFSERWGGEYSRVFDGRKQNGRDLGGPSGMMGMMGRFTDSHGVAGKIIQIALPKIVVAGQDNVEKEVLLDQTTTIQQFRSKIEASSLKVGDSVVVFGSPNNDSTITARLIRVMPVFESGSLATSTIKK